MVLRATFATGVLDLLGERRERLHQSLLVTFGRFSTVDLAVEVTGIHRGQVHHARKMQGSIPQKHGNIFGYRAAVLLAR